MNPRSVIYLLALVLAVPALAAEPKVGTPEWEATCQDAGTCWIPAGGKPQPIVKDKFHGLTFKAGVWSGTNFALPGTKVGDGMLRGMATMEQWYGPWCLLYGTERSYFQCLRVIWLESRGNPYGATDSTVLIERGLTSVDPGLGKEYGGDPCGDPEWAIWVAQRDSHDRRAYLDASPDWQWLKNYSRREQEKWASATGSLNANAVLRWAKDSGADEHATPFKRMIGWLQQQEKKGVFQVIKAGVAVNAFRMGFRLGRAVNNGNVFALLTEDDTDAGQCWGSVSFYDPNFDEAPGPTPKHPWDGKGAFGAKCSKHKAEWKTKLKSMSLDEWRAMQSEGYFPTDEQYAWWEANIGACRVSDLPLVKAAKGNAP